MSSRSSRTLYVGNLPGDIREREVEDLFYKTSFNDQNLLYASFEPHFAYAYDGVQRAFNNALFPISSKMALRLHAKRYLRI